VRKDEGHASTLQGAKSDAERAVELEDELLGEKILSRARMAELSQQMFGHYGEVPPVDVISKMRAVYLDTESLHRMMVDQRATPRWLSRPFCQWINSLKSPKEQEFEDLARNFNTASIQMVASTTRLASVRLQPNPIVESIRNEWATTSERPFATPSIPRLGDRLPPELPVFQIDPAVRASLFGEEAPDTNKED
jgi:hypothetical protein